jgi:hypothetical protein
VSRAKRPGQRGFVRSLARALAKRRGRRRIADPLAYAATVERRRLGNPALAIFGANRPRGEVFGYIDSLPYRHVTEGRRVHHFSSSKVAMIAEPGGDIRLHHAGGKPTWGRDGATIWAENPGGKMARSKRRPPHGYSSWGAWMRHIRPHKGKRSAARASYRQNDPGPKRRRGKKRHTKARARRRVRYGINPGGRGVMGYLRGVPSAILPSLAVTGGEIAARAIPSMLPATMQAKLVGPMGLVVQGLAAVAAGFAVSFVSPMYGRFVLIGGLSSIEKSYLRGVRLGADKKPLPIIGAALGDASERYALAGYYFGPARRSGVSGYLPRNSGVPLGGAGMESAANVQAQRGMMTFG